jgi:hypothetical protein
MLFWRFILILSNSSFLQEPLVWVLTFYNFCRFFWVWVWPQFFWIPLIANLEQIFKFQNLQAYVHIYITHFPMLQKVYMCVGYGERHHMFEPLMKVKGVKCVKTKGGSFTLKRIFQKKKNVHSTFWRVRYCANPCWSKFLGPLQMQRKFFKLFYVQSFRTTSNLGWISMEFNT